MEYAPRFDFEPKQNDGIEIEGRIERPFSETEITLTRPTVLPKTIIWPNARLRFTDLKTSYNAPIGTFGLEVPVNLYFGALDYVDRHNHVKTLDLSSLAIDQQPICFSGSENGFYAHDPETIGRKRSFYLIGVQPDELIDNMRRIVAIYHELGHVFLFANNYDISLVQAAITKKRKDVPELNGILAYAQNLAYLLLQEKVPNDTQINNRFQLTRLESQHYRVGDGVSLFHERYAWAGGGRLMIKHDLPSGFKKATSFTEYAKFCLGTYAKAHKDDRFTHGFTQL
ncbi:hypothetical protein A2154_04535 [Candidatus Gottesmanbacteria bacterium RBG_16_43_7]|uniref:Uncharacterized protein n=1 Tax=Candidatus Gottesmanbacteria bacterium RBG_16_43_7 TaxID=1798373 RepID=A0A1F5ZBX3_9BACT|nr:MAG: hypothetical protein A2154_04535 [Candidatus Gottesmanbacteria bacterium RBG_16_43_7]